MGGFTSGLVQAGFQIRWASDKNRSACKAFRHRLPNVRMIEKDVCTLSVQEDRLTTVDLLTAGFPCQSFSQAGDRRGFDDPRGKLFFEIPRLLREFLPKNRPALVVLENVPHLLHGENGIWFDCIRRELRRSGYWFRKESCWILNVKDATTVPQDRKRLFMLAASREHFSCNPFCPALVPTAQHLKRRPLDDFIDRTKRGKDKYYLHPENRYHKMIEGAILAGESDANIYQLRRSYVREKKQGLCPTLTANMGNGGHNVPFVRDSWGIRRLAISEVARLQGFNDTQPLFPQMPEAEQYRLLGNAVCADLAFVVGKVGGWIAE